MKKIVLFASGSGSNAEKIISFSKQKNSFVVDKVLCNNSNAKVLEIAKNNSISSLVFTKEEFLSESILRELIQLNPDLIVLAGFLLQIPKSIVAQFPNKIINIHPALLPKYGGKGMYGSHVHNAVFKNKEVESGITIHYVNENYDEGAFIFQKSIDIQKCISADEIAKEVLKLEHQHFAEVIEQLLNATKI